MVVKDTNISGYIIPKKQTLLKKKHTEVTSRFFCAVAVFTLLNVTGNKDFVRNSLFLKKYYFHLLCHNLAQSIE